MKGEPNEENCSVSDNEDTGPLSEVTAESAAVEAGTLPEPTMKEKKVEPEAMPEVNPESVPAGDLDLDQGKTVLCSLHFQVKSDKPIE